VVLLGVTNEHILGVHGSAVDSWAVSSKYSVFWSSFRTFTCCTFLAFWVADEIFRKCLYWQRSSGLQITCAHSCKL